MTTLAVAFWFVYIGAGVEHQHLDGPYGTLAECQVEQRVMAAGMDRASECFSTKELVISRKEDQAK